MKHSAHLSQFFRKTISQPDGSYCHDADCKFFTYEICTCGLLHQLRILDVKEITDSYPKFFEEDGKQSKVFDDLDTLNRNS